MVNALDLKFSGHCDLVGSSPTTPTNVLVMELAYIEVLKTSAFGIEGSSPSWTTKWIRIRKWHSVSVLTRVYEGSSPFGSTSNASVAELADAQGLGPCTPRGVEVRILSEALCNKRLCTSGVS